MITEFLENLYEEVAYQVFYRELFPEGSFEQAGVYETGMYNGIALAVTPGDRKKVRRYTITDDLEVIDDLVSGDDFCIMSPISYAGKSRKSENARYLYALVIDLDGVDKDYRMRSFLDQFEDPDVIKRSFWALPRPTYLVSSGTGLHIYYVFGKPIALFRNAIKPLENLKRRLTWQAWTQGASSLKDKVQYESLFQGFRMVGSITKTGSRTRAFRVGEKVTIEDLNDFVPPENRVENLSYRSNLPLSVAKERYPEWYQRRIVEKQPKGSWRCKRDLYDWWKRQSYKAEEGHRYWYLMTLATYAVKCGIDQNELEADALGLVDQLNRQGNSTFGTDDAMCALEAFNDSYVTYPIKTIEARTGIRIDKNKRNGRKQEKHLQGARAIRDINNENWREGNGRPDKEQIVIDWQRQHPEGKKIDCERETGLSRHTVLKWWSKHPYSTLTKAEGKKDHAHLLAYMNMLREAIESEPKTLDIDKK